MRGENRKRTVRRFLLTIGMMALLTAFVPTISVVYAARRARVMNTRFSTPRETARSFDSKTERRPVDPRQEELNARLQHEYGAVFLARNGVVIPPRDMFSSEDEVGAWQAGVSKNDGDYILQTPANAALAASRKEARALGLAISPGDVDAAARNYAHTIELWRNRVEPGLDRWVSLGRLDPTEAERIRTLPGREQTIAILELEKQGMFFSKDFTKSILSSVAPPGTSQHLALLAFDVKEHRNPRVRAILERHGWYQTVFNDEPHFTYLGMTKLEVEALGLKTVVSRGRRYWVMPESTAPATELLAQR